MKVVALVPIKMNNERTPGKNTKAFFDGTPLIHFILNALLNAKNIDEVYVYCSNEDIKNYLLPGVKYLKRDKKYDANNANVNDMFYAFSQEVNADIYVLAHATAPFLNSESIDNAVNQIITNNYDSAIAVTEMKEFLWKDGKPVNYDVANIPRTQDLDPYYVETTGMYVYTYDVITKKRSRIGNNPYLQKVSLIESTDINNPIDFELANAIYKCILNAE